MEAEEYNKNQKEAISHYKYSNFNWGVNIRPVMEFMLSDHWMMDITLDALGLSVDGTVQSSGEGSDKSTTSGVRFGFNMMKTLNPNEGHVASQYVILGFAYKF